MELTSFFKSEIPRRFGSWALKDIVDAIAQSCSEFAEEKVERINYKVDFRLERPRLNITRRLYSMKTDQYTNNTFLNICLTNTTKYGKIL